MPSQLLKALSQIARAFDATSQRVYSPSDLSALNRVHRRRWHLPVTPAEYVKFLLEHTKLRPVKLSSAQYSPIIRYVWGRASLLEIAQSLGPRAYLSHGTAAHLHGLIPSPALIYVNREQTAKRFAPSALTQDAITRAFAHPQRISRFVYRFRRRQIMLLSGKHTGRLQVRPIKGPAGELLEVTSLERTLIDLVVRPLYAGGVDRVLNAFVAARDQLQPSLLLSTLQKLQYVYPYHQAIGFYLERAGYPEHAYAPFAALGTRYDFYLAHGMQDATYDSAWRLFYPGNLRDKSPVTGHE